MLFAKHAASCSLSWASNPTTASATAYAKIQTLPAEQKREGSKRDHSSGLRSRGPALAMVDSDKGITNLHVPSDVIVDASMPAMIRTSRSHVGAGRQGAGHQGHDPGRCYAGMYQAVIDDCQAARRLRSRPPWATCPTSGLMAQAAEEYGSHDKTFEIAADGVVRVVDARPASADRAQGRQRATSGACARPRTLPIRDWVKLARQPRTRHRHARDVLARREARRTTRSSSAKVQAYLQDHDTTGLDIRILAPGGRDRGLPASASAKARTRSR